MRILHTCLRYPPASGGTEKYVHELVERTRYIPERDVRVLTSKMRTHNPITELDPKLLMDDAPYVQRLHHAATPYLAYPRLQALRYYIGHHRPDVIHGYSFWYQPADVAARYARTHTVPFIFHPLYYENEVRRKPLWQLYKKTIGWRTFKQAAAVIVISPYEQQLIEAAGFPVKRFVLIPPGVDLADFRNQSADPFARRGISGHKLLAVGRLSAGKGLADLIAALPRIIREYPATHLVMIGEDFGIQRQLQTQAQAAGVAAHVHFWGKVSDAELRSAYEHADLLVHASDYEAFGIVLAESLAAKTPVIARNTAAIPYVVPHGKAGLLFHSVEELVGHVITLLGNPNQRAALGESGYQHVVNTFTWDRSIQQLFSLYTELGL